MIIYLKAPAVDGKANRALKEFLSETFSIPKEDIQIIKGLKSPLKTINIYRVSTYSILEKRGIIPRFS